MAVDPGEQLHTRRTAGGVAHHVLDRLAQQRHVGRDHHRIARLGDDHGIVGSHCGCDLLGQQVEPQRPDARQGLATLEPDQVEHLVHAGGRPFGSRPDL